MQQDAADRASEQAASCTGCATQRWRPRDVSSRSTPLGEAETMYVGLCSAGGLLEDCSTQFA